MATWFWAVGTDSSGTLTTAGAYASRVDAEEQTGHLSNVRVYALPTRQHVRAKRMLRDLMERERQYSRPLPASDEPAAPRGSVMRRRLALLMGRKEEDIFDD